MNKGYLLLLSIFFVNVNSYQPPELGLFFETSDVQAKEGPVNINVEKERRADGTYSYVYNIKSVADFLYFATRQELPLIINIYSKKNVNELLYQELADTYVNKFVFVSVDSVENKKLTQLLFLFLKFDGFSVFPTKIKYPLILFCRQNSIFLQNGQIHLKKGTIKNLINPGSFDKKKLLQKLKEV